MTKCLSTTKDEHKVFTRNVLRLIKKLRKVISPQIINFHGSFCDPFTTIYQGTSFITVDQLHREC